VILADTSVWVAHFRKGVPQLAALLNDGLVLAHPMVVGELACGNLRNRARILSDLEALPPAACATPEEVLGLVEARGLWGLGIGWIDAHLLAAALLSTCPLWTLDARLLRATAAAGVIRFPAT
jgi:predicted nucleic acid-binding protein